MSDIKEVELIDGSHVPILITSEGRVYTSGASMVHMATSTAAYLISTIMAHSGLTLETLAPHLERIQRERAPTLPPSDPGVLPRVHVEVKPDRSLLVTIQACWVDTASQARAEKLAAVPMLTMVARDTTKVTKASLAHLANTGAAALSAARIGGQLYHTPDGWVCR